MTYRNLTALLAAIAAGFAFLPYPWARIVAGAIGAAIASYHVGPPVVSRMVSKLTTPKQRPPL